MSKIVLQFEPTLFTPSEAARISGVSTGMQRDWRSRGFLPRVDGHARFDAAAVAQLMVMQALSVRTIGPQQSITVARRAAAAIVRQALVWVEEEWSGSTWAGDPEACFDALPIDWRGPTEWERMDAESREWRRARLDDDGARFVDQMMRVFHSEEDRAKHAAEKQRDRERLAEPRRHNPHEKREWLLQYFAERKGSDWYGESGDLIWWANGEVDITGYSYLQEGMATDDPRVAGAVVILPVVGMASQLVKRAARPLLEVRVLGIDAAADNLSAATGDES